jgi:hypothetical protein
VAIMTFMALAGFVAVAAGVLLVRERRRSRNRKAWRRWLERYEETGL